MKIGVCDIHYYEDKGLVEARYRVGFNKGGIKIDVCREHQDYFKGITSDLEARKKYTKLETEYWSKKMASAR